MMSGAVATKRPVARPDSAARTTSDARRFVQDGDRERAVEAGVGRDREPASQHVRVRDRCSTRPRTGPTPIDVLARRDADPRARGRSGGARCRPRRSRTRGARSSASGTSAASISLHDGGVEADAEVEQEPAIGAVRRRRDADADARERARRERPEQLRRSPRSGRARCRACARTRWSTRRAAARARWCVPTSPPAASLSVPSPREHDDDVDALRRRFAGELASRHRDPAVSTTSTSCSAASASATGARARDVTDEAIGLTISRRRTAANHTRTIPQVPDTVEPNTLRARSPTRSSSAARARGSSSGASRSPTRSAPRSATTTYWGRPVPGFGDPTARVLIAGLAPAAHGGNRTGRVFTGDRSGDWLFGSLHRLGFANQPTSVVGRRRARAAPTRTWRPRCGARRRTTSRRPASATAACRTSYASSRCSHGVRVVVVLGGFAYDAVARVARRVRRAAAGAAPEVRSRPRGARRHACVVLGCYHPSQQNTFTGRLTEPMIDDVFRRARELASGLA